MSNQFSVLVCFTIAICFEYQININIKQNTHVCARKNTRANKRGSEDYLTD